MSFTKDQEAIVLKVLSYKPHQFYEILCVEKSANESEIKKSYRKLAIKCHPDKNPHPRSAEAFKLLNKAWGVLSDPSKKNIYDQTGSDPDSRFGSGAASSGASSSNIFNGGTSYRGGGVPFDDDIFNLFFGGGSGASPFGGGRTTFQFGNGFSFQSFDGADPFMRHRRQYRGHNQQNSNSQQDQPQQEASLSESLRALAPILLILIVPIFSALFSDSNGAPEYSFLQSKEYSIQRTTPRFNIPFYVNKKFSEKYAGKTPRQLKNFDYKIENVYIQDKRSKCSREQIHKNEMIEDAQGWFFTDTEKLTKAENMPMPNCEILRGLNLI
ncbi:putative J domain-containing protein [Spathaspora sp. JA1]|nr:putative J domain-containing protein [Spathaspora sp. JA1]